MAAFTDKTSVAKPCKSQRFNKNSFRGKKKKNEIVDAEIKRLKSKYSEINAMEIHTFADFPLSEKTQNGLNAAKYVTPTDIQRQSISRSLAENDILGAAKTGSGKTLAFIIPVLERLYQLKWSAMDGLGALIISPTRELAYQIFEVIKNVGRLHDFSVGLVIGGKSLKDEADRINYTNIVICTPGRLLQHMDETAYFNADNLQILVLDEADRILDMGFQQTMNAIIMNLPEKRQTLLFSATQTKSVKDLARLSLKNPTYVSVHENAEHSTPAQLQQSYLVCELHEKLDILWSFLKNHLKRKILVFFSSCKQVRFVHESLRRLQPGVTVLALHGAMAQLKRVDVYEQFCRKQTAILFATDIAARGLDFPAVHWVVQYDCPEDANTYIHRAGRTARYEKGGEALLILLPSEQTVMVEELSKKKIPIQLIRVNPKKKWSIEPRLQSLCAAEVELKEFAQRAVVAYMKSVFLMSNKKIFDVTKLDVNTYARSMGLAIAPRLRFLQRAQTKQQALAVQKSTSASDDLVSDFLLGMSTGNAPKRPLKKKRKVEEEEVEGEREEGDDGIRFDVNVDLDDVLTLKRKVTEVEDDDNDGDDVEELKDVESVKTKPAPTKYSLAKKLVKKNLKVNTKVTFDEDGEEIIDMHKQQQTSHDSPNSEVENEGGIDIARARQHMLREDKFDKQFHRDKIKKRKQEQKTKEKKKKRAGREDIQPDSDDEEEQVAVLDVAEGSGIDIDDLPDPDKLYGPAQSADEEGEGESDSEEEGSEDGDSGEESGADGEEDEHNERRVKRHRSNVSDDEDDEEEGTTFDTGLDLMNDEALALKLLQS